MNFPEKLKIQENTPTANYTKIKIGGQADFLVEIVRQADLVRLHRFCRQNNLRLRVLGEGTNVFFDDEGYRGVVAVLKFNRIEMVNANRIRVEAGAVLSALQQLCAKKNLAGFEFAAGIPGSVGGAIYGNAGAYGKNVGECLFRAKILLPNSNLVWVEPDFFKFSYRHSALKTNQAILLEAEFQFEPGDPDKISQRVNEILELRRQKLPPDNWATVGSYFKNLKNEDGRPLPAGKLLEAVGSKQTRVGDMAVYYKHANIFYNHGTATAHDLLQLEAILKQRVLEKFGIELEREVMYISS
jgi:UDP-N-acetylmuramate dehydrogenase